MPCEIYYGRPMVFDDDPAAEDSVIQGYVDQVKGEIARLIEVGLERRARRALDEPFDAGLRAEAS